MRGVIRWCCTAVCITALVSLAGLPGSSATTERDFGRLLTAPIQLRCGGFRGSLATGELSCSVSRTNTTRGSLAVYAEIDTDHNVEPIVWDNRGQWLPLKPTGGPIAQVPPLGLLQTVGPGTTVRDELDLSGLVPTLLGRDSALVWLAYGPDDGGAFEGAAIFEAPHWHGTSLSNPVLLEGLSKSPRISSRPSISFPVATDLLHLRGDLTRVVALSPQAPLGSRTRYELKSREGVRRLTRIADLEGKVEIGTPEAALQFVRLTSEPGVLLADVIPPRLEVTRWNREARAFGQMRPPLWEALSLHPPTVEALPEGFVVRRTLAQWPREPGGAGLLYEEREVVSTTGRYTRRVNREITRTTFQGLLHTDLPMY